MSARTEILERIRTSLGPSPTVEAVPRDYRRSAESTDTAAVVELLVDRLVDYRARVERVTSAGIRDAIARATAGRDGALVTPAGLEPSWTSGLDVVVDDGLSAEALDRAAAAVTGAATAIAETGTIVLDASPNQGRRAITLVPDLHVCVLYTNQVVLGVPDAMTRLDPSRPLTLISGPSATSDIELARVEGVHGPRTLHVIIVD